MTIDSVGASGESRARVTPPRQTEETEKRRESAAQKQQEPAPRKLPDEGAGEVDLTA